jgi:acetyl-CoA carboxylase carboxyl transferase subunit alpha
MPSLIVGHQKGRDTKQRQYRNFGMPKPEGYRKAIRAMKLAEKFDRPIFTFIDTPGAYPGIDAEERGQAEAIAYNLREMAKLTVPVIVTVIGEGGSGGALAIGVGDQVQMLENAIYSVISPEGCAAILWKDSSQAARAAEELRLTAAELKNEGIVDQVIAEPKGGAQNSHDEAARLLDVVLCERLAESATHNLEQRLTRRYQKLRQLGKWGTSEGSSS